MNTRQTQISTAPDPLNAQSKISPAAPYYPNLSGYYVFAFRRFLVFNQNKLKFGLFIKTKPLKYSYKDFTLN